MSYSFEIKLKAVKMYLEEGIGSTTIAEELNLNSNKRILLWIKRYNEFGEYGVKQSMSRKGNCYDNACIENFFGHLKTELIYQNSYSCEEELVKSIDDYMHWYNNYRFQAKLKNMTPVEYRCHMIA